MGSLKDSLGMRLEKMDGSVVETEEALKGKVVVLYFSAEWCPPCKVLTPLLRGIYEDLVGEKKRPVEVVFVSSDTDAEEMREYCSQHGDWLRVPFGEEKAVAIAKAYKVDNIPALVIVRGSTGEVISYEGKAEIVAKRTEAVEKWAAAL